MILSLRNLQSTIPDISKCIIHTTGTLKNGDSIEVTSPIFSSIDYGSKSVNLSDRFNIEFRSDENDFENDLDDGECYGELWAHDDNPFDMYVIAHRENKYS